MSAALPGFGGLRRDRFRRARPRRPIRKTQMAALEPAASRPWLKKNASSSIPRPGRWQLDAELSRIALARASDMAAKNYLAHTATGRRHLASLLMKEDATWQGLLGENLAAQHYTKQSGVDGRGLRPPLPG